MYSTVIVFVSLCRRRLHEKIRNSVLFSGLGMSPSHQPKEQDLDATSPGHQQAGEEAEVKVEVVEERETGPQQVEVEIHEQLEAQASESSTAQIIQETNV